jgi:hypothetical protein
MMEMKMTGLGRTKREWLILLKMMMDK